MFWVLTLFLYGTIHAQNLKNYSIDAPISEGLTLKESNQLQQDIERAMVGLPKIPRLRNTTQLIRPIKQADSFNYHHVFALASHVDHDERKPGYLQDYNCGSFTADGNTNNHSGTDFVLWPFGWHQMDLDQAEVIAAAAGQIVHKIDGRYDRNCLYRFNPSDGNAIFVQHADGTVAWYMNLKSGSLTEKTVGQMVEQGEYLGIVGSSGNSFYPHLHFELRDEEGNVIDPYAGPCNPGESRWANQPDYLESGANYLTTYSQPPNFNNLCDPADQFFQDTYAPGDTLYFLAFIRQQKKGQSPRMGVRFPDGTTLTDRSTTLDRSSARSYFIHSVYLPADAPGGTYSCLLDFDGKTYETSFEVQAEHCSDPKQSNMAAEVYSSTEAQISYAEKNYSAYQWQIRVEGSTSWITLPVEAYRLFIRGLSPQTTYQYRVRYRCGGQWTNWSGIAIFTTPMDTDCPPIELSQTTVDLLSANRANISIQVPGKDAYDWRIRVPGESWTNVHSIPDCIYTFDELSAHTTYLYQVRVKCGNRWSAWSETGSFTTPASVPCPTPDIYTVLATALNSSEVQLTSPDQNKDRYDWRIRLQGSTSWISLPSTGFYSNVLQGLQPGATYEIQHAWRCGSDWSSWSDTLVYNSPAATCPAPALDEIEFEYNSPTLTTIRIHGYTVAGYQIRYREKGTAIWQESAPSAVPMISIPTEPGKEYEFAVRIFCAEEWSPWSETKDFTTPEVNPCLAPELNQTEVSFLTPFDVTLTLKAWTGEPVQMQYRELGAETWLLLEPTGSDSVFQVDNLKENTIYQFRLRAICSNIPGSWSMIGLFTTPELNECPEIHTLDVMVVPVSETTVQLIAPVFPNVKYQWRYRPTESGSWTTIPATNASSLILEGLLSNTNYEVQLRVICTTQTTMWSASTLFVTGGQAPCSPPDDQLVAIYNITTDGFSVGLTAEDDKTNYRLRYRKNQSSAWDTLTSTTLPFQLAGLEEGTTYQVAFSWYCTSVWSGWTPNIDVNTLALPDCDPLHPDNITASEITREQITITYPLGNALRYQIRYRMQGSSTWTFMERKSDPEYIIIGLQAGTTYEFQIRQECVSNVWSAWSESNLHSTAKPYFCAAPNATDMIADQLTAF
ncbi:MAG: fibronectin type III domain-containing protein, partial [Saprospiraceae bacterium]|nr:fibronectin type III domain-containing protein [Saprospiraceae bacterium]